MIARTSYNILEKLLDNFPYEYNINQLSRLTKMSIGGVHRALKKMEAERIVHSSKKGNALFYQFNIDSDECTKMLETLQVQRKMEFYSQQEGLKTAVEAFKKSALGIALDRIFAMLLFRTPNGYDMLVISVNLGEAQFKELKEELDGQTDAAKKTNISVLILTLSVFEKHLRDRKGFYRKLWSQGIIIYGESFLFQELRRGVVALKEG